MKTTEILGITYTVDNDLNLLFNDQVITAIEMQAISDQYKGSNRIYKPMALLFWIDVKNGNYSNWK